MTDRRGFVEIHGWTPAAAACAAVLARAGVPTSLRGSPPASGEMGLVSTGLLEKLQIVNAIERVPVDMSLDRQLSEDEAVDSAAGPTDNVILKRSELVAALVERAQIGCEPPTNGTEPPVVRINAADVVLGCETLLDDDRLSLDRSLQSVQIVWDKGRTGETVWVRMTGDPLAETKSVASLLITKQSTSLTVLLPTETLVTTSITLPDVVARLMAHPVVSADLPKSEPVYSVSRVLAKSQMGPFGMNGRGRLRIGAVAGLADAIHLDRELNPAIVAAEVIAAGINDGRVSLSYMSRIPREWQRRALLASRPH